MRQQHGRRCSLIFLGLSLIAAAQGSKKKVNKDHWGYYSHCSNTASLVIDSKWDSSNTRAPKQIEERRTWLPSENELLLSSVKEHLNDGPRGGINWPVIADILRRSVRQCQARYFLHYAPVNPQKAKEWTIDEYATIWLIQRNIGNNWNFMAKKLPGRTPHAVRNQWFKVVKKMSPSVLEQAAKGLNLNFPNTSSKVAETPFALVSTKPEFPSSTPKIAPSTQTLTPPHIQPPPLDLTELSPFSSNWPEEFKPPEDLTVPELNFPWIDLSDKVFNDISQSSFFKEGEACLLAPLNEP